MRSLRCRIERRAAGRRVVVGNGIARFHRIDDNTVVDELKRNHARGLGEGGFGRLRVPHVVIPIENDIAGNMAEKLRRARGDRILRLGHHRQRTVFDLDRLGGIPCRGQGLGHHQRDWLASVPHLAECKHRTGRVMSRRTVPIHQRRGAGQFSKTIRPNVLSRGHEQDTRHVTRRCRIDALDMRMRCRRAQNEGMGHVRQNYIVRVAAPPGDEAQIFMTPNRLTDAEFHCRPLAANRL